MSNLNRQTSPDIVVFRRWRDTGSIIALFPELPADLLGQYCDSFETIGQHGAADYMGVIVVTRPAKAHEYTDLARELETIGYNLRVVQRVSHKQHARRTSLARAFARRIAG